MEESAMAAGKDEGGLKRTSSSPESADKTETREVEIEDEVASRKKIRAMQSSPSVGDEAGSESPIIPEKLEVPSKELQCIQKQVLIEKMMGTDLGGGEEAMDVDTDTSKERPAKSKTRSKKPLRPPARPPPMKPEEFRKTFKIPSSILNRVKTFLPEMKNANEELLRLPDPSKLSLESDSDEIDGAIIAGPSGTSSLGNVQKPETVETEQKTYVEMNLALLEQSDSDSSSDDEVEGLGTLKGLPVLDKTESDGKLVNTAPKKTSESPSKETVLSSGDTSKPNKTSGGEKSLITELN